MISLFGGLELQLRQNCRLNGVFSIDIMLLYGCHRSGNGQGKKFLHGQGKVSKISLRVREKLNV